MDKGNIGWNKVYEVSAYCLVWGKQSTTGHGQPAINQMCVSYKNRSLTRLKAYFPPSFTRLLNVQGLRVNITIVAMLAISISKSLIKWSKPWGLNASQVGTGIDIGDAGRLRCGGCVAGDPGADDVPDGEIKRFDESSAAVTRFKVMAPIRTQSGRRKNTDSPPPSPSKLLTAKLLVAKAKKAARTQEAQINVTLVLMLCAKRLTLSSFMNRAYSLLNKYSTVSASQRTFWRMIKLWRETGDVVQHSYGAPGCPRTLNFDDVNYLLRLMKHRPDWFLDERHIYSESSLKMEDMQQTSSLVSEASFTSSGGLSPANSLCQSKSESAELEGTTLQFDGLKINFEQDYCDDHSDGSDIDKELKCEIFKDEEFGCRLAEMVQKEDDKHVDWIPEQLTRKALKREANRKSCPTKYKTGPDVMSKSVHTQQ
ncbi:hypothetical protein F4604DRAFT_2020153 [Suillus subluteus]|nr:hypothetical protein F4604DRAFT_2020153 [Suillus subluteus]